MNAVVRSVFVFLMMCLVSGCASFTEDVSDPDAQPTSGPEEQARAEAPGGVLIERAVERTKVAPEDLTLIGVQSEVDNDVKVVRVIASAPFNYVVYLLEMPRRLAIELPDMKNGLQTSSININGDLISKISVVEFEKANTLRLEIYLNGPIYYDLTETGASASLAIIKSNVSTDMEVLTSKLKEKTRQIRMLAVENKKLKVRVRKLEGELGTDATAFDEHVSKVLEAASNANIEDQASVAPVEEMSSDEIEEISNGLVKKDGGKIALTETIGLWRLAWQEKDFVAYSSYYADSFVPEGQDRGSWTSSKIKKFDSAKNIAVDIEGLDVSINDVSAKVKFLQKFRSDQYQDVGFKTLRMVKTGKGWKIESETWRRVRQK